MRRLIKTLLPLLLCALLAACAPVPQAEQSAVQTAAPQTENALPQAENAQREVRLLFINVGKADAMLLQAGGRNYLVDTGEKDTLPQLLTAFERMDVKALDALFLTHTHSDHMGAAKELCKSFPVRALYCAGITELSKKGVNKFEKLSEKTDVSLTKLKAGDSLTLAPGVEAEVLGPLQYNAEDDNDNSLVLLLTCNGKRVLLTGDMQFAEEDTLLKSGVSLSADALKVGNHGNPDATGEEFARAVSPSIAVISTDTAVDADSANPRVLAALGGAAVYLTQDCTIGLLLAIDAQGNISAEKL